MEKFRPRNFFGIFFDVCFDNPSKYRFWVVSDVFGLLERPILRSNGGLDLLLCFVSSWCTNNKVIFNVVVMLCKSRKCILTVKTLVFCKIFILVFLSLLLIILARKYLNKHFKMGVQDAPKPFQNAACFELVKQSAFMIDFGRILGANWDGFGGLRLRHEPSSLS